MLPSSPDHLLIDRKCNPPFSSIRTILVMEHSYDAKQAHDMAEEFMTLYRSGGELYDSTPADSLERQEQDALERENM